MKNPINTPSPSLTLPVALAFWLFACLVSVPALAQDAHHGHHGHDMPPAKHESAHEAPAAAQEKHAEGHEGHSSHSDHAAPPSQQPSQTATAHAVVDAADTADGLRDPHAYADGYVRGSGPYALTRYHLGDEHPYAMLLLDRLDWGKTATGKPNLQFDGQWSWGSSYNRLLLQSEGHAQQGKLQESQNEVLWSRAAAPFWNTQLGLRLDQNPQGKNRQWLAFGVEGLAPYWVEVHAKAYLGAGGRSAVQLGADYDLALSQKWYLQPSVEAHFYGQSDAANQLGSGLSSAKASLRLRYEAQRQVAPYIGVERQLSLGQTGDLVRSAGQKTGQTRWFAGLRLWF